MAIISLRWRVLRLLTNKSQAVTGIGQGNIMALSGKKFFISMAHRDLHLGNNDKSRNAYSWPRWARNAYHSAYHDNKNYVY